MAHVSAQTLKTMGIIALVFLLMVWNYVIVPEMTAMLTKDFAARKHSKDFRTPFITDVVNLTAQQHMPFFADQVNLTAQYQMPDLNSKEFGDIIYLIDNAVVMTELVLTQVEGMDSLCKHVQTVCSGHMAKHIPMKEWCDHIRALDEQLNLLETCDVILRENLNTCAKIKLAMHEALTSLASLERMNPEMTPRMKETRGHIADVFVMLDELYEEEESIVARYILH